MPLYCWYIYVVVIYLTNTSISLLSLSLPSLSLSLSIYLSLSLSLSSLSLSISVSLPLSLPISLSLSLSQFGVGASSFQSPRSPVLCSFYIDMLLLSRVLPCFSHLPDEHDGPRYNVRLPHRLRPQPASPGRHAPRARVVARPRAALPLEGAVRHVTQVRHDQVSAQPRHAEQRATEYSLGHRTDQSGVDARTHARVQRHDRRERRRVGDGNARTDDASASRASRDDRGRSHDRLARDGARARSAVLLHRVSADDGSDAGRVLRAGGEQCHDRHHGSFVVRRLVPFNNILSEKACQITVGRSASC